MPHIKFLMEVIKYELLWKMIIMKPIIIFFNIFLLIAFFSKPRMNYYICSFGYHLIFLLKQVSDLTITKTL